MAKKKKPIPPQCLLSSCQSFEKAFEDVKHIHLLRSGWGKAFAGWMPNSIPACKKCRGRLMGKWRYAGGENARSGR